MVLFYSEQLNAGSSCLTAEDSRHCVRVLRMKEGETLRITDGRGNVADAVITTADPSGCRVEVSEPVFTRRDREYNLHIAIAPPKNPERLEWFVEKAVEIGCDQITILDCQRNQRRTVNMARLEKIVISALKQSLSFYKTRLTDMTPLEVVLADTKGACKLIAHCVDGNKKTLKEMVHRGGDHLILIGPEGDFTDEEIKFATGEGCVAVSLGDSRLRTETAGIFAVSALAVINQ